MLQVPARLINNGKPVFGTFYGPVARLDIRGLRSPFGKVPLPALISNFRIKSTLSFCFNVGQYTGDVIFFDGKIFGLAEVVFWDRNTGRKYAYKTIMGPRRRFIPHNLQQGFCASFGRRRYIRISWDHKRDRISMIFNLSGDSVRPSVQAALTGHYSDSTMCEVTQCVPFKSKRRCSASYLSTPSLRGSLTIGKTKKTPGTTVETESGPGLFYINRSYMDYLTKTQFINAAGTADGKQVAFFIANLVESGADEELINRNMLIVDGQATPLPPVKMTQPFGLNGKWIIQDTENMVDLTFESESDHYRHMSFIVSKIEMHILYGKFEGVIKTKDGQDIKISGFAGFARDQLLRV